jgi:proteasome lid subunit RPN8/RPN11
MTVVGFYHSHPDHPPSPSATDAECAWPGYVYLICSLTASGATETKAWVCDEALGQFVEWPIEIETAYRGQPLCDRGTAIRR